MTYVRVVKKFALLTKTFFSKMISRLLPYYGSISRAATNNHTQPSIFLDCQFSTELKVFFCVLYLVICIVSIIVNLIFCHAVYSRPRLHKLSMVLLVNLSISDITINVLIPFMKYVFTLTFPYYPLKSFGADLYNAMWIFSVVSPFATVTAITIERYIAINRNAFYERFYTPATLGCTVLAIWTYSLTWIAATAFNMEPLRYMDKYDWNVKPNFYYVFIGVNVGVQMFIIPAFYYRIWKHVMRSREQFNPSSPSSSGSDETKSLLGFNFMQERELKLTRAMAKIIVTMYIVWMPVFVVEVIYAKFYSKCVVKKIDLISVVFTSSSGVLNPIIYSYKNAEIKKYLDDLKKLF